MMNDRCRRHEFRGSPFLTFMMSSTNRVLRFIVLHQPIYLPQTTLAEIGYFLTKRYGNLTASFFLARFPNTRYRLIPLADEDVARTAEILQKYADTRVDFVDATIAAVAERLNITRVLTLDRRDFSLIRPKHIQQFELLPEKA
ncbi:MAG: PIN domain-containing protein [Chloroflexi bacterium]|uniref:type II toxin-antitoxin system VapC family toxin n=1 Tax=Candidatus Flexifilum breve TaxID=3140694 RepID=UPI003137444E|nr:PIN domain-containing protein [Chloroflexota bacterium]